MAELYSNDYFDANYGHLVSSGAITPQILSTLKRQYATAYKSMCDAASKLPDAKSPDYNRIWIVWMLNYCERYYLYLKLLRYLREKDVIDFTEDELTYAWGMIKQRLDAQEDQAASA